ncbi:hypothetical protein ABPG72_009358 [Tetrahymena utriculariae]
MQVVPILTHQTSKFSNLFTQNILENPSKVHSAGGVTKFQAFQASMVSMNVINPISQSSDELSSQKSIDQHIHANKQIDNQVNDNQQEVNDNQQQVNDNQQEINDNQQEVNDNQQDVTDCRQRLKSDATTHLCWFCKEQPKPHDPFLSICKCSGSNLIHASCLMKIADDQVKKNQIKKSKKNKKQLVTEHNCSICKYKFKSISKFVLHFDFSVTMNNFLLILLGFLSLGFSIGLIIIGYQVFIDNENEQGSFQEVYLGLFIFLLVLCLVVMITFLLLAIYMFYKAFFKVVPKQLELISDIKDKLIIYSYDQVKETYYYDQALNRSLTQKENKTIPQTLNTMQKSPLQKKDNYFFNIQETNL